MFRNALMRFLLFLKTVASATALLESLQPTASFSAHSTTTCPGRTALIHQTRLQSKSTVDDVSNPTTEALSLRSEADILKTKAEQLRKEIGQQQQQQQRQGQQSRQSATTSGVKDTPKATASTSKDGNSITLPWSVETGQDDNNGEVYRLYVDVGREEGTWMDARWGASGNRIPFTLDVMLLTDQLDDEEVAKKMVKDNNMGKSSKVFALKTAPYARLREGFDRMACYGGAYRIDLANNGQYTIRMMVEVEGTKADQNYVNGDVTIPKGYLYFSLPCFGGRINQLSTKEGPVTVRQVGWHTGWRREESRILATFRAKSIKEAKRKDKY